MDDGSRSAKESLQMLEASARQGVRTVVLTPHFNPTQTTPARFLRRRAKALQALANLKPPALPELRCGAEVPYFEGLRTMRELPLLKIEGTDLLLIEMPFEKWSRRVVDDIFAINSMPQTQVILAHIERYIGKQEKGTLDDLVENGILIQSNADFFLNRLTRRRALRLLRDDKIHILGSDCHNMTTRAPNLGPACDLIRKKLGAQTEQWVMEGCRQLLIRRT